LVVCPRFAIARLTVVLALRRRVLTVLALFVVFIFVCAVLLGAVVPVR
jgi:hypothetical protein